MVEWEVHQESNSKPMKMKKTAEIRFHGSRKRLLLQATGVRHIRKLKIQAITGTISAVIPTKELKSHRISTGCLNHSSKTEVMEACNRIEEVARKTCLQSSGFQKTRTHQEEAEKLGTTISS